MTILATATTWSDPVTLTRDEVFQCHQGIAYITLEDAAPDKITDGIKLGGGNDRYVAIAGAKVRWAAPTPSQTTLYRGPAGVV